MSGTRLTVQVRPGARRNEVLGLEDGVLKLKIAAPATEGKANRALVEFLADLLGVSKSSIAIEHGERGKSKVLSIAGLELGEVWHRLGLKQLT